MNETDEVVEAIGIEGDRIAAVGSRAEVAEWAGGDARIVDLDGKAIVPGFVDAHRGTGRGQETGRIVAHQAPG